MAFNTSISLTELILSTVFELGKTTLSSVSNLMESYFLAIDSIFGSTETSRAISEIIKLVSEEFKDSSEHVGEVGMRDIVAGLTCFAILQYRTHARLDADAVSGNRLMWNVMVDATPPVPAIAETTQLDPSVAGSGFDMDRCGSDDNLLPPVLFDMLSPSAEITVMASSSTTCTTTIEAVGTSPPNFTPPPGAVVVSESSQNDGKQRYKIIYETVKRSEQSKRLRREDGGELEIVDVPAPAGEDAKFADVQRFIEIDDTNDENTKPELGGETLGKHERSKWRDLKVKDMAIPSDSDTDRPPLVPKTKVSSPSAPSRLFTANQTKKRANSCSSAEKEKKKEKARERERGRKREEKARSKERSKEKGIGNALRKAFSPPVFSSALSPTKEKKKHSESHHMQRSISAINVLATAQTIPSKVPSRRPSITSRPASPDTRYSQSSRHHYRRGSFSTTTTTQLEPFGSIHSLHTSRREMPPRPSSAISMTSYDGDLYSSSHKQYVPSVYTLHASHSSASLHLMYTPPTTEDPGPCYPSSFHLLHNLRKYIRFAAASYGAQFMRLLLGSQFLAPSEKSHHLEHQAFSFHTSLPVDTIVLSSHYDPSGGFDSTGHTGTGRPLVHFVCVDHEAAAIVVTCRGTLGLEDVLTDLTCEYTTISIHGSSYRVHKGMYNSAVLLLQSRLLGSLATTLANYPDYGLVLTGHSLGAGVAALVSILISGPDESGAFVTKHDSLPQGRPIHCYAFGSPAIVCQRLRKATRGLVTTVVNGNDVVPSLSIGVIRDFHSVALTFREDTGGVLAEVRRRVLSGLWYGSSSGDEWSWEVAVLKTLRAGMTAEKLVPPGEVWRVAASDANAAGKKRVRAWVVEDVEKQFGEVTFAKACFADHSPGAYEETLEALMRGVVG